ncbi:MAG: hypothetical protein D6722_11840 [Bacteroidetes bacterium]|nr:MAG: hypothetical protein D6722_11840 [Bacteroidota bacterium]
MLLMTICLTMGCRSLSAQQDEGQTLEAKIEVETEAEGMTRFLAVIINNGAKREGLRYELKTTKQGPSGRSSNQQAGQVKGKARSREILSSTQINLSPADSCVVTLHIIQGDEVLATDSWEQIPNP